MDKLEMVQQQVNHYLLQLTILVLINVFVKLVVDDDIYQKEKLDGKNLDFKIITDKNFRPEIPKIYLNDKKFDSYIGFI
jgi:hypothetical protein